MKCKVNINEELFGKELMMEPVMSYSTVAEFAERYDADNAFGYFRTRLQQKLEYQGKQLVKIGRFTPSSTVCSECGAYHKDIVNNLSIREWVCPDCGTVHNRDQNAAKNILHEGLRLLA